MKRLVLTLLALVATHSVALLKLDSAEIFPGQIEISIQASPYRSASRPTFLCVWPDGEVWIPSYPLATSNGQFARYNSNLVQLSPLVLGSDPLAPYLILPDGTMLVNLLPLRSSDLPALHHLARNGLTLKRFTTDGLVMTLALQEDGKVLVGGTFTIIEGYARNKIARLLPNLTVDPSFNIGIGPFGTFPSKIVAIEPRPTGEIYIGGNFQYIGFDSRHGIARLLPDGKLDLTFDAGDSLFVPSRSEMTVEHIKETGGRVYAHAAQSQGASFKFTRLYPNGIEDINWSSPYYSSVHAMLKQRDGKIVVAGTSLDGQKLKRLHSNGTGDSLFRNFPTNYQARYIAIDAFENVFVAGNSFTARLFSDKTASLPALNLTATRTNGSFYFALTGPSEANVTVERSANLTNWTFDRTLSLVNGTSSFAISNAPVTSRFFRGILR